MTSTAANALARVATIPRQAIPGRSALGRRRAGLQLTWQQVDEQVTSARRACAPRAARLRADALYELAARVTSWGCGSAHQLLAERDPRLAPFMDGVLELAARFKMKAVPSSSSVTARFPLMPETILIVDDTPANLGVLVETLGEAGYQLMVAEDGEEALAQVAQTQPDPHPARRDDAGPRRLGTCRRFKARRKRAMCRCSS